MENETDVADISKTAEEADVLESTAEEGLALETDNNESVEDVRARLAKAEELATNYKIRAEKAEKKAKEVVVAPTPDVSSRDTIALINAKVNEEDVDEVVEYAKFKKISVAEALKSNVLKATLKEKEEQRATAEATSTGKVRPASTKSSGESLLGKAEKTGELPDRDEDLDALLEARFKK